MLGSHPPQASEDSFSDDDELIGLEDQLNEMEDDKSGLPRHIMERRRDERQNDRRVATEPERPRRSNESLRSWRLNARAWKREACNWNSCFVRKKEARQWLGGIGCLAKRTVW